MRSDSRSRLAESELSMAALDRVARQAAALALAPPDAAVDSVSPRQAAAGAAGQQEQDAPLPGGAACGLPAEPPPSAAALPLAGKEVEPGEPADEGEEERSYAREATLSYPRTGGVDIPVERRPPGMAAAGHAASLTFRPAAVSVARIEVDGAGGPASTRDLLQAPLASGPGSDTATRGSVHGSAAGNGGGALPAAPHHQRAGSGGSTAGPQRSSMHYKSMSADSTARGGCRRGQWQGLLRAGPPACRAHRACAHPSQPAL